MLIVLASAWFYDTCAFGSSERAIFERDFIRQLSDKNLTYIYSILKQIREVSICASCKMAVLVQNPTLIRSYNVVCCVGRAEIQIEI